MSLPNQVEVLVVGAGPAGLAAAITLSQLGIQVAIVDSSTTTRNDSRAAIVHSRTLEVLNTIGLAETVLEHGVQCAALRLYGGGANKIFEIEFCVMEGATPLPSPVLIGQHDIERIFRDKLKQQGVDIYTNMTVTNIRTAERGLEAQFLDGSITHAKYVVGADGGHSTASNSSDSSVGFLPLLTAVLQVRKMANISFKDPFNNIAYDDPRNQAAFHIAFADIRLKSSTPFPLPRDLVCSHLDVIFLTIPLPSVGKDDGQLWRIGFGVPSDGPEIPPNPSIEYLQQQLDERNPWDTRMEIAEVVASSRYRVRSALAETYYKPIGSGHILLAGDAAHVHSPVGGQGMNLGICDAVSAGHAISAHIKAVKAISDECDADGDKRLAEADAILRRYSDSRHAIGKDIVGMTKTVTALINLNSRWKRMLRDILFRIVGSFSFIRRVAAWKVSGIGNRD